MPDTNHHMAKELERFKGSKVNGHYMYIVVYI
jgi:hypothetical protein